MAPRCERVRTISSSAAHSPRFAIDASWAILKAAVVGSSQT